MTLSAGTKIGPYEIQSLLGAGGMGEVYRARDTRLERTVAVKILPPQFSLDPTRQQRFRREARIISNLNDPHICVLHDIGEHEGIDYLVMEYLEGETLSSRLKKGALPMDQILRYGAQISVALDKANRNGVMHRDLKPGNIMLTPTGAKLLDFGLARQVAPLVGDGAKTFDATRADPATEQGTIVGTFQYMSPEQVEGKAVDGRSDIFSLGAVLYEMATGRRAFEGNSPLSTIAAILEKEPAPIGTIVPMTPPALDHAIRRCLAKDPEDRWQSARDLALELKWVAESGGQNGVSTGRQRRSLQWLPWGLAVLLAVALAVLPFRHQRQALSGNLPTRFQDRLPPGSVTFSLSPDGRRLAFVAPNQDGHSLMWIRDLDSLEPRPLRGTEDAFAPVPIWSPNSRFVAYQSGSRLKKIDITGGPSQTICDASVMVLGGSWNRDDILILGTREGGLVKVPAAGGDLRPVTTTGGRNEVHTFPVFLPDGRHFFYLRAPENSGIYIGSLDTEPERQSTERILATSHMAVYVPDEGDGGRLLFIREGILLSQPFDEQHLRLRGEPVSVAEQVGTLFLSGCFSVSASGALAYRGGKSAVWTSQFKWFDRQGKELSHGGEVETHAYTDVSLSPDGTRLVAARVIPGAPGTSIWLIDLNRDVSTPLTFDPAPNFAPVWSPDGKRVAFSSWRGGRTGIYLKEANGGGKEQPLLEPTPDLNMPNDWSSDGRFLLFTRKKDAGTNADLWILSLSTEGTPSGPPVPFADTQFSEHHGQFSPDGSRVAYTSNESGRSEIYVQPFPRHSDGSKTMVSRGGGNQPRWRRDGKELFYLSLDGNIMVVETPGPTATPGVPKPVIQAPAVRFVNDEILLSGFGWDVTPDGMRFLVNKDTLSLESVTYVLNWTSNMQSK